jgi:hypothetical protein
MDSAGAGFADIVPVAISIPVRRLPMDRLSYNLLALLPGASE